MSSALNDQKIDSDKPLKVLIAGAGLAGLATAIALRRQGHDVEVIYRQCRRWDIWADPLHIDLWGVKVR